MDANEILGVAANAGPEEIRAAYLSKVKDFPPDRAPAEFEKIRNAYDELRYPRRRAQAMFRDGGAAAAPLVSMLENRKPIRLFAGPQLWREVLKDK